MDRTPGLDPHALRSLLRADLLSAMKERRAEVVSALRTVIAALDNAEAVDAPCGTPPPASAHVAGARAGVGSTEARRRVLSSADVRRILESEIANRLVEAERYDAFGQHDAARRLRREADALAGYVGSTGGG